MYSRIYNLRNDFLRIISKILIFNLTKSGFVEREKHQRSAR